MEELPVRGAGNGAIRSAMKKASSLVPAPMEETGNKKPNEGVSEEPNGDAKKVVPAIRNIDGNKGTSNFSTIERCVNTNELLVPAKTGIPLNSEKPGRSFSEEVAVSMRDVILSVSRRP